MNGSHSEMPMPGTETAVEDVVRSATHSADIRATENALTDVKEKCDSPDAALYLIRAKEVAGLDEETPLLMKDLLVALRYADNALAIETAQEILNFRSRVTYAIDKILKNSSGEKAE